MWGLTCNTCYSLEELEGRVWLFQQRGRRRERCRRKPWPPPCRWGRWGQWGGERTCQRWGSCGCLHIRRGRCERFCGRWGWEEGSGCWRRWRGYRRWKDGRKGRDCSRQGLRFRTRRGRSKVSHSFGLLLERTHS